MSTTYTPDNTGDLVLSYTEPQDGDAPDVASVNVFLEGLADDVSRLANSRVIGVYTYAAEDESAPVVLETFTDHTGYTTATNAHVDVPNCLTNDTLIVDAYGIAKFNGGGSASHYGKIRLKQTNDYGGTPSNTSVTGALVWFDDSGGLLRADKFTIPATLTVMADGTTRVAIQGTVTHSGDTLEVMVACVIRVQHMRLI